MTSYKATQRSSASTLSISVLNGNRSSLCTKPLARTFTVPQSVVMRVANCPVGNGDPFGRRKPLMEIVSCLSSVRRADRPEATNQSAPSVDRFRLRLNQLVHTAGVREVDFTLLPLRRHSLAAASRLVETRLATPRVAQTPPIPPPPR
ncbi:hypothetical protein E2C01_022998 [Portunus trituberculatus]|uniref:Uncharacterized protein n=1 Tax=Portunus trituberculatus TaxID=210409 RepID=A0A5B7E8K9_PORTR|nr:hypothetical protein [Portunus trituberculatus]